jgi:hypothetical protein
MAKVNVKVSGGRLEEFDVDTLGDLKSELDLVGNYSYAVNGQTVTDDDYSFSDFQMVNITENIKSGQV